MNLLEIENKLTQYMQSSRAREKAMLTYCDISKSKNYLASNKTFVAMLEQKYGYRPSQKTVKQEKRAYIRLLYKEGLDINGIKQKTGVTERYIKNVLGVSSPQSNSASS